MVISVPSKWRIRARSMFLHGSWLMRDAVAQRDSPQLFTIIIRCLGWHSKQLRVYPVAPRRPCVNLCLNTKQLPYCISLSSVQAAYIPAAGKTINLVPVIAV